jgi:calcineurin-like phosphoesterase family protein
MNTTIIKRWNERVKPEDLVFHVGDFCFRNSPGGKPGEGETTKSTYYRKQLNGSIIFIKGNHDGNNSVKTLINKLTIKHGNYDVCLPHFPDFADFRCPINFTGHVHTNWQVKRLKQNEAFTDCINVGTDVWGFRPISFDEIMKRYHQWLRKEINEKTNKI